MSLNNSNNNQNSKIQSFLESLRASRGNPPKTDKVENQSFNNPFKEIQAKKEIEQKRVELFFQARQKEWSSVYSAKDKERENRIQQITEQLKKLAVQLRVLDKNVTKALEVPVVETGVYHESFLQYIQKRINILSLSVNSTNTWLQIYTSRATKKGYYHQMAKSKGNSFTQSNERTVATSVG